MPLPLPFRFAIASAPPSFTTPPTILANLTTDAVPSSCASTITPACLQALYGIPTTSNAISTNILGVSGFIEQYANKADLKTFLQTYRTDMNPNTTFSLATLDGGSNPQTGVEPGLEAVSGALTAHGG